MSLRYLCPCYPEPGSRNGLRSGKRLNAAVIPLCVQLRRSYKQLIHSQSITAIISYKVIRGNHVSFGLTHLDTVLSSDHTLVEQFLNGSSKSITPISCRNLCIETGVQQMQTACSTPPMYISTGRYLSAFSLETSSLSLWLIHITQEIPGRTCPLRHGVGLSLCRSAARGHLQFTHRRCCQRRFTGTCRLVALNLRKS